MPKKIRWVLAHEPIELFQRAVEYFVADVNRVMPNAFDVECLTLSEYSDRYCGGQRVTKHDILDHMEAGKIEVSQMYTTWLAERYDPDLNVLDLPYLFGSHDHADAVLNGSIGAELLSRVDKMKALAFTYSGGFRIIPATVPLRTVEDFEGLRLRANRSPVATATIASFGAVPVKMELEDIRTAIKSGDIVGGESTYPRFFGLRQDEVCPYLNDTGHSLFLTCILASDKFWASLTEAEQDVVFLCARRAADYERAISIADVSKVRADCASRGIEVVVMTPEERSRLQMRTWRVYKEFLDQFSDLINAIRNCA